MGDRTFARTTFREEFLPLIEANRPDAIEYNEIEDGGDGLTSIIDYEANYGEIHELRETLGTLCIPNDHSWENGGDYQAGTRHTRFDSKGGVHETEYTTNLEGMTAISLLQQEIKDEKLTTLKEVEGYLAAEAAKFEAYENQDDLTEIPLREFTDEEAAIIMKSKLEKHE